MVVEWVGPHYELFCGWLMGHRSQSTLCEHKENCRVMVWHVTRPRALRSARDSSKVYVTLLRECAVKFLATHSSNPPNTHQRALQISVRALQMGCKRVVLSATNLECLWSLVSSWTCSPNTPIPKLHMDWDLAMGRTESTLGFISFLSLCLPAMLHLWYKPGLARRPFSAADSF